ncbi:MAG: Txe/YoeB family addiction module toxin [Verrucomicrobiota bacterium]|jgi:toxin YoeB|nr:Txe/YoeB family addiction module toxin [Verrucomicrobiota bacterium]
MALIWKDQAWGEYLEWQRLDRKTLKKINSLLESIRRNGYQSIGKVEKLKGDLSGLCAARIDAKNRLVFYVRGGDTVIASCSGHYGDR